MMQETIARLAERTLPILPVIQVDHAVEIIPIAEALAEGGIRGLEITLRTPAGLEAIRLAKQRLPNAVICAGTVTSANQLHAAIDAGAEFAVTPGISESLVDAACSLGIDLLPGVATPTELMTGLNRGLRYFKLFPAAVVGGIAMLKALNGPFPQVKFCPTGGLNADNFTDYLALPNVFSVGGSWMIVRSGGVLQREQSIAAARAIARALG
jgi:2-dehydro-3-deoxyphosphogluconate aldolase/(4S)-4-hydroxy-2-oxoglutarate aldolase